MIKVPSKNQFEEYVKLCAYNDMDKPTNFNLIRNMDSKFNGVVNNFLSDLSYSDGLTIVEASDQGPMRAAVNQKELMKEFHLQLLNRVKNSKAYLYLDGNYMITKGVEQLFSHFSFFKKNAYLKNRNKFPQANHLKIVFYSELSIYYSEYISDLNHYGVMDDAELKSFDDQRDAIISGISKSDFLEGNETDLNQSVIKRSNDHVPERLLTMRLAYSLYRWKMGYGVPKDESLINVRRKLIDTGLSSREALNTVNDLNVLTPLIQKSMLTKPASSRKRKDIRAVVEKLCIGISDDVNHNLVSRKKVTVDQIRYWVKEVEEKFYKIP